MSQHSPFSFLENSTTQALLGTASAAVGPGFLSGALGIAPAVPQLVGEALRKVSIGNTLTDAFTSGEQELSDDDKRIISQIKQSGLSEGGLSSIESGALERGQLTPAVEQALSGRRGELRSSRARSSQSGPLSPEQQLISAINSESNPQALNELGLRIRQSGGMTPAVGNAFSQRAQALQTGAGR